MTITIIFWHKLIVCHVNFNSRYTVYNMSPREELWWVIHPVSIAVYLWRHWARADLLVEEVTWGLQKDIKYCNPHNSAEKNRLRMHFRLITIQCSSDCPPVPLITLINNTLEQEKLSPHTASDVNAALELILSTQWNAEESVRAGLYIGGAEQVECLTW